MTNGKMSAPKGGKSVTRAEVRNMVRSSIVASQELKCFPISATGVATTTAGSITPITQAIVQGDSLQTRDGNQIVVKKFVFRHQLTLNVLNAVTQRVIVFWDNQANGSNPSVVDVLNSASWISPHQPTINQPKRFHFLLDEFIVSTLTGSNAKNVHVHTFNLNHRVTFIDTTNIAGASGKGAMYVLYIADGTNGLHDLSFEIYFTDS